MPHSSREQDEEDLFTSMTCIRDKKDGETNCKILIKNFTTIIRTPMDVQNTGIMIGATTPNLETMTIHVSTHLNLEGSWGTVSLSAPYLSKHLRI